jgi:hypothetical protein
MKTKNQPSAEPERILIVFDGQKWCIRHIYIIEHKLDFNRMVYHSDRSMGGPFGSVEEAVAAAKEMLYGARHRSSTRIAKRDLRNRVSYERSMPNSYWSS